ncbi:MAG: Fic family protein, partial [Oceanobacter sp.]
FVTIQKPRAGTGLNRCPLNEDYLTDLQNEVIDNPFNRDASYRFKQNYLSNGRRGPLGISYVPPAPELARNLIEHLLALANSDYSSGTDPLVLDPIVSFGFIFIHPYMDGNGRLSRFLLHHVLCQQGALGNGLLLPVSTVLKQREMEYKAVLESGSGPTREFWETDFIADDDIQFTFTGHEIMYRYWDVTEIIEFMGQVTEQAIEKHLKDETLYLTRYDELYRRINDLFDIPNSELSKLVMFCIEQKGQISKNRRKQYQYLVSEDVFETLEEGYKHLIDSGTN